MSTKLYNLIITKYIINEDAISKRKVESLSLVFIIHATLSTNYVSIIAAKANNAKLTAF